MTTIVALLAASALGLTAPSGESASTTITICTSPNAPILDLTTLVSELTIEDTGTITDLDVYLLGSHSWLSDLRVSLIAPSWAPSVFLFRDILEETGQFSCSGNDFDLTLDDQGTDGSVQTLCRQLEVPALTGRAVPEQPLSAFNGLAVDGTWQLTIFDKANSDQGELNTWCLVATRDPASVFFDVTADVLGGLGSITPATQQVSFGSAVNFTVTPDKGWAVNSVTGDTCTPVNIGGADWQADNITAACAVEASFQIATYPIGGTILGLAGSGLELALNDDMENLSVSANGTFQFNTELENASNYFVTVASPPTDPSQTCTIANANGTVDSGEVTDIDVTCTTDEFTVGGIVFGLDGDQVVLQNNGGDNQIVLVDGTFTFSPQADGTTYAITIATQPNNQICRVLNGSGTLAGTDVDTVMVECLGNELFLDRFEML